MNTMNKEIISAKEMLRGTGVSVLDAVRYVKNILDAKPKEMKIGGVQFVSKVVETGLRNVRTSEMGVGRGFELYVQAKSHLRPDSRRDIRCLGRRLLRTRPEFAGRNFSELSRAECEQWLAAAFTTDPQFNKARAMLHGLFNFALRREWCDRNPIKFIERRKVVEKEIIPLKLDDVNRLIAAAKNHDGGSCAAPVALLVYAGIRPREVRRLRWSDIDTDENVITVRSQCSKTGGVRQVEICPALKRFLSGCNPTASPDDGAGGYARAEPLCPRNWEKHWREIRKSSGFCGRWTQDVLRHTYASYHAKRFSDLPRLQLNMGHRDLSLLLSRYVNMRGISRPRAKVFFN